MTKRLTHFLNRFYRDERGVVFILFALMLNSFVILLALNIDIGRAFMAKTAISAATDAAALAAGHEDGDLIDAQPFFEANLPNGKYGIYYDYAKNVSVGLENDDKNVVVKATDFEVPYYFGFAGREITSGKVSDDTAVQIASAAPTLVDYYLVVDVSNSMEREDSISPETAAMVSRQQATKESIRDMIDLLSTYDNEEGYYRLHTIAYGTSVSAKLTNFTNLAFFSDKKLDQLVKLSGFTCGSCGLDEIQEIIQKNGRTDALQVVIFMTDGYFNYLEDVPSGSALGWPLKKEFNQCLGFCGRAAGETPAPPAYGDIDAWRTEPTGRYSPIYDAAREAGEFDQVCDTAKYVAQEYPELTVPYPGTFPTEYADECMPAYAQVANYCEDIKSSNPGIEMMLWTIRFGDFSNEGSISTAFANDITKATMDFCASNPQFSRKAESGIALSELLTEIVNSTARLKILR